MRTSYLRGFLAAAFLVTAVAVAFAGDAKAPANWHSAIGVSHLADAKAAGDEAAAMAKAALNGTPAKLVMIVAPEPQITPALIEGVVAHFPADVLYGCQVASPITPHTNYPDVPTIDIPAGVAVWALGGDMDIAAEWVATDEDAEDPYYEAGVRLASALAPAVRSSDKPGKIIITFGDQYNGANKDFASGLNDGFEEIYPIVGAAAGNITSKVIVKGEIKTGINVALLVADRFTLGQALNGGTHTPETADKTLADAVSQGDGKEPFFSLIFNCRRRRQGMIENNQLAEELAAMKKNLPGVEFFGFYGPGEIGSEAPGEPAKGVGFTVVTAVFFADE